LRFEALLDDGRHFGRDMFEDWLADELSGLGDDDPNLAPAATVFYDLVTRDAFEEFLTLPAYELLD